jgi:hypothetical protein
MNRMLVVPGAPLVVARRPRQAVLRWLDRIQGELLWRSCTPS